VILASPPADLPALVEQCAPGVGANTMHALIATESKGNPWALNDNDAAPNRQPVSRQEAAVSAKALIAAGHRVDIGLTQVDSENLGALHLSVDQILEPCTNIAAGAAILAADYRTAVRTYGEGQQALLAAFSAYNTGKLTAGFANGYVNRILAHRGERVQFYVPKLAVGAIVVGRRTSVNVSRGGWITPYTAPLVSWARERRPGDSVEDAPQPKRVSPKSAPLEAAGFRSD